MAIPIIPIIASAIPSIINLFTGKKSRTDSVINLAKQAGDKINFHKYGFSVAGGWEIQEVAYGVIQDIVIISLIGTYYYGI